VAYLKAAIAMTLGVYSSALFIDCNLFQMGWFVVARFLLTSFLLHYFGQWLTQPCTTVEAWWLADNPRLILICFSRLCQC